MTKKAGTLLCKSVLLFQMLPEYLFSGFAERLRGYADVSGYLFEG